MPTDHLGWIGAYILERRPDVIVHVGDHADMPSLSSYDKPGSKSFEGRRYQADVEAARAGLALLDGPLRRHQAQTKAREPYQPERWMLLGNHEDRINRAVEADPRLDGTIGVDDLGYSEAGWRVAPFLEPVWLDGVAYAHYWYNPNSGRPYSGMVETRLKNIGHSFTQGHLQTFQFACRPVAGRLHYGLIAGACYLHDEDYKGPQGNAHWRGIIVKHEVSDGQYDVMPVSLDYLCRRYEGVPLEKFCGRKF